MVRLRVLLKEISSDRSSPAEIQRQGHSELSMQLIVASDTMALPLGVSLPHCREGCVSAPAGVAPEALEECLHSSKGYKCRPA